jgi:hypothetical protein
MRDLIPIREILKEIMLEVLDEKFKPECTTHSKAVDTTPSPNEIIPQSEVFEDNSACLKFAQMPKPPHTKYIPVPLHWWRSEQACSSGRYPQVATLPNEGCCQQVASCSNSNIYHGFSPQKFSI